jgi:stage II sporulation protein D
LGFQTLRSDQWQLLQRGDRLEFAGSGEGHGAGLCQLGAQQMGAEGHGYREILAFYYAAAQVGLTARGLDWQRYSGERVSLMSTRNGDDSAVLTIADRLTREIAAKYNWAPPAGIEIRVYPDLDTFRNATSEPGWVAARTSARRIELQPAAMLRTRGVLEGTLRHELLHVFVEAQAVVGLPLWFREGLVGYLEGAPPVAWKSGSAGAQQKGDEARARSAYAANTAQVGELVRRYGRDAVLDWLRRGMPPEVRSQTRP